MTKRFVSHFFLSIHDRIIYYFDKHEEPSFPEIEQIDILH